MIQKNPTQDYKDGFIEATELLASHMLRKIERQPDLSHPPLGREQ